MNRENYLALFLFFLSGLLVAQNDKPEGGCDFYITNPPTNTLYCKNTCNDTVYVCPGDSLELLFHYTCVPSGTISNFNWTKDGNAISGANTFRYIARDTGVYACVFDLTYNYTPYYGLSRGSINVLCNATTGIEAVSKNELRIFPNPFTNYIELRSLNEIGRVAIFNSLGESVIDLQIEDRSSVVDVSQLSPGIYFLRMQNAEYKLAKL